MSVAVAVFSVVISVVVPTQWANLEICMQIRQDVYVHMISIYLRLFVFVCSAKSENVMKLCDCRISRMIVYDEYDMLMSHCLCDCGVMWIFFQLSDGLFVGWCTYDDDLYLFECKYVCRSRNSYIFVCFLKMTQVLSYLKMNVEMIMWSDCRKDYMKCLQDYEKMCL